MTCRDCKLIKYSKTASEFSHISSPFIYIIFSECIARKAYEFDPKLYIFKLGYSSGNQDRLRSLMEGWRFKGGQTQPLANCKNWEVLGTWKMKGADVFERKFIKLAKTWQRIVPPHVYGGMAEKRTNGETEIYWLNELDFQRLDIYQDKVCTEERGSFAALAGMFATIVERGDRFQLKMKALER
jgi:hypothetical protein